MVQQHRPGIGIERAGLVISDDHVEVVVALGPRAEGIRRGAARRRHHHLDPVAEVLGPGLQRQRLAFHDHRRLAHGGGVAIQG